jgi:hypothetical protein
MIAEGNLTGGGGGCIVLRMAKTEEMTERERQAAEVLRDLHALPPSHMFTPDELMAFIQRMPGMPEGWTSADYIREYRGSLPEQDAELDQFDRR